MRDRIHFSHILPVIDLALLVLLIFVPISVVALHLYGASKGSDQIHLHSEQFDITIPRDQIIPWAIRVATVPKAQLMKSLNLPGLIPDILISLPTSWPNTWHPKPLLLETWDALAYPFFALPFWWLVGCGLDGLLQKERIHWSLLLSGTLLSLACLTLLLGFSFGLSVSDQKDSEVFISGATGWTIAFALLPAAWIAQFIRRRRVDGL